MFIVEHFDFIKPLEGLGNGDKNVGSNAVGRDSFPPSVLAVQKHYQFRDFSPLLTDGLGRLNDTLAGGDEIIDHENAVIFIHLAFDRFADAIRATITSEEVKAMPVHLGAIDQFVDSTDVLSYPERFDRLKLVYQ